MMTVTMPTCQCGLPVSVFHQSEESVFGECIERPTDMGHDSLAIIGARLIKKDDFGEVWSPVVLGNLIEHERRGSREQAASVAHAMFARALTEKGVTSP